MRYETILKAWESRNVKIREMLASGIPQSEIARKLRISRQRVWQILNPEKQRSNG